ncbi:MAG: acetamidase/formamidase family protein [Chloroflexi bacterium]|nr:acetamidase/formamidase family protein [Chloroflexota bacterium]MCL5025386.1 acetamidase/formamidase family protein [Chloroflexota bacterium]
MKTVGKDRLVPGYSPSYSPALVVDQGETFVAQTHDRFGGHFPPDPVANNMITGPVFVRGAQPGQVLKVDILDIRLTTDHGFINIFPDRGGFQGRIPEARQRRVPIADNYCHFSDKIKVPLSLMVGRIGVAPKEGEIPSNTVGPHGGNMDNNMIIAGASVYLPLFVEGGLLSVGDIHAAMGDGESCISGVETAGDITMRCSVVTDLPITRPLVVSHGSVMTTAEGDTLDEAARIALFDMADLMVQRLGLDFTEAAMLISVAADLRVCEIVNPKKDVKVVVPSRILPI